MSEGHTMDSEMVAYPAWHLVSRCAKTIFERKGTASMILTMIVFLSAQTASAAACYAASKNKALFSGDAFRS
jgi:hypothetical protein